MTRLTLGEIEALCQKAARGAGLDWGLAEEAGRAARALAAAGLPGPEALAAALAAGPGAAPRVARGRWTGAGPLCPLRTGTALADFALLPEGPAQGLALAPVRAPLLLLPFVALAAARWRGALRIDWGAGAGTAGFGALRAGGALMAPMAAVRICAAPAPLPAPALTGREIPAGTREVLEALALATTVPPSAASRTGAGAAADDND